VKEWGTDILAGGGVVCDVGEVAEVRIVPLFVLAPKHEGRHPHSCRQSKKKVKKREVSKVKSSEVSKVKPSRQDRHSSPAQSALCQRRVHRLSDSSL
jgi:hypothetical protein